MQKLSLSEYSRKSWKNLANSYGIQENPQENPLKNTDIREKIREILAKKDKEIHENSRKPFVKELRKFMKSHEHPLKKQGNS